MTEALEKELEEDKAEDQEDQAEGQSEEEQEEQEESSEDKDEEEQQSEDDNSEEDEEERKRIAREKYQERQRQKQSRQEELQEKQDKGTATREELDENEDLKRRLKEMEGYVNQQVYQTRIKQAEKELNQIEQQAKTDKDFKSAYPDYEEKVNNAIEFAKIRLMQQGMSESEAAEQVSYEKTMLADKAVASGSDPLEAIYSEAEQINKAFEAFADKLGYKKSGKTKTNLQAQREASKPNALGGGAGKGANAITRNFDELGDDDLDEIKNTSIWDIA